MAIPAITNNSPQAGYIAWGAFTIQLNGVAYSVPAGSTNQRWVWWEYRSGAPIINAGAEVPNTLVDDDLVLFANKNGIGVRVQSTSFVDGELLVDGSIFSAALSTNLISSQHIVTAGLDAGVIKFGVMHGDRIAANTITAEKLTVGSLGGDLVRNGGFEDDVYWTKGANATRSAAAAISGAWGMRLTASGGVALQSQQFPCAPGDSLAILGDARGVVATTGLYFRISWRNSTGGEISITDTLSNAAIAAGAVQSFAAATPVAPAGTVGAIFQIYNTAGTVDVDDVSVRKVVVSAQIADGAITANKVKAGELNSGHITTQGLDAAVVKFGTMHGDRITANTLATKHIVTAGLDAAVVKFGTMHGDRITAGTMNADRIIANTLQAAIVNAGAVNGITITGSTLQTASSGSRLVITGDNNSGRIEGWSGEFSQKVPALIDPGWAYYGSATASYVRHMLELTSGTSGDGANWLDNAGLSLISKASGLTSRSYIEAKSDVMMRQNAEIQGELYVVGALKSNKILGHAALPVGCIMMFATPGAGTPWLYCNGQAVSRTQYAALFNAIGTAYGAGDGSTTFNLPNLQNRFPRGSGPGTSGGSDTVTMPEHSHYKGTLAVSDFSHTATTNTSTGGSAQRLSNPVAHGHNLTGETSGVVGSNPAISNIPLYTGVHYYIRYE